MDVRFIRRRRQVRRAFLAPRVARGTEDRELRGPELRRQPAEAQHRPGGAVHRSRPCARNEFRSEGFFRVWFFSPNGRGFLKIEDRGQIPQGFGHHGSTLPGVPFWNSGFSSHGHIAFEQNVHPGDVNPWLISLGGCALLIGGDGGAPRNIQV